MNPSPSPYSAAVHIGASHASMMVSLINDSGKEEIVDFLVKNIPLGRDIFRYRKVRKATIEHAVEVIHGFQAAIAELALGDIPVRAVATNTLTEASNADTFLNRLQIACSWRFKPLDDGEMTRLVFLKTRRRLRDTPSMQKRTTIVAHVGPGNTRILLFKHGQIIRYQSYRLGTHRTWEALNSPDLLGPPIIQLIREQISGLIAQLHYDFSKDEVEDLVMIGTEIQMLSSFLSKPDKTKSRYKILDQLTTEIAALSEPERVKQYKLDYQTAGSVLPALIINAAIAESFELTSLRVSGSDYERGLLTDLAHPLSLQNELEEQMLHSAFVTAQRYDVNIRHAEHVAHLSRRLFDESQSLHQLGTHDALILQIASILHEVGNHISPKSHELHSLYIIRHSEIFGLNDHDRLLAALVARYHRKACPELKHSIYKKLNADDRIRVAKLSAILRVADALERTHSQRVTDLSLKITSNKAILHIQGLKDATAERLALPSKADLFEKLFGLPLILTETA